MYMTYRNNFLKGFLAAAAIAISTGASAQTDLTPQILHPDPVNGALLYGLSDNGEWGVSSTAPGYDGFSDFAGASIYDLRSDPVQSVDLSKGETFCAGFDVTDDGKTVAGAYRQQPAICRLEADGQWHWYELPVPDRTITLRNNYTDVVMTYKLNSGEATNITPDGRYAVGYASCNEYIQIEVACMWDLETLELMDLPGLGVENTTFSRVVQISADGKKLVCRRGGYVLYDRDTRQATRIPVGLDIYAQGMCPSGRYISGVVERNDIPYAAWWDVENNELTVLEDAINADAVAWIITDAGMPLVARPYLTPYADAYVCQDGFLYSFDEVLTDVYGLNLAAHGIDNTGKPFKVSADGRTVVFITGPGASYVVRFREDIADAISRVDLFSNWSATPVSGTRMSYLKQPRINFSHEIELVPGFEGRVQVLDKDGNVLTSPVANGGTIAQGNSLLLRFSNYRLTEGETYTLVVPEGMVRLKGLPSKLNPELRVVYEGRANVPVVPVKFSPEPGSSITSLSLADNPVSVVFDEMIQVNVPSGADRPMAKVYIDGESDFAGFANLDVDLYTGNTLVIFPDNDIPFYKGSVYTIVVPEGAVTDMSGSGPSERFTIDYAGSLVPQLGEGKYLFNSTCDSYTNFLFYEGDHGNPTDEYVSMGFTRDQTPWSVVRESESSTDMAFGSHSSYSPLVQADDWVATRQILIPDGASAYLAFDSQSYRKAKTDYLKVYVYENAASLNSLTARTIEAIRSNADLVYNERQSPGATEANLSGEWTHNVIDLTPYAGKSIYICFLNDNYDGSMVMIDNIQVVNDIDAFITLLGNTNVVAREEAVIRGLLTVSSETARYSGVDLRLLDADGREVSKVSADGLDLRADDIFPFEFPRPLPLEAGVVNPFTIEYSLDGDAPLRYEGAVRNLSFEPEKHVVIEEFTGRDCKFCPSGIVAMEHLVEIYGDKVIPVVLHCYMGTDPKGHNVMGYSEFTGLVNAPSARVNRGPESMPIYQTSSGYVFSGVEGERLWHDLVADALGQPALVDVAVESAGGSAGRLDFRASFRSALTMDDCNYRVFGVLLEDGVTDVQNNAYYATSDPLLGEWGAGGQYGKPVARYEFNNVARETWGTGYNGTGGLLPTTLVSGETYTVDMSVNAASQVNDLSKCKFVVMLIDEDTGLVVNASRSDITSTGVSALPADGGVAVSVSPFGVTVVSAGESSAALYDLSGRLIASASGNGSYMLPVSGFGGVAILRVSTPSGVVTRKLMM